MTAKRPQKPESQEVDRAAGGETPDFVPQSRPGSVLQQSHGPRHIIEIVVGFLAILATVIGAYVFLDKKHAQRVELLRLEHRLDEKLIKDELANLKVRIEQLQGRSTSERNEKFADQDRGELRNLQSKKIELQKKIDALISAQIKR